MWICVLFSYLHMHIHVHVYTHTHTHAHTHTHTHTNTHIHTYTRTHAHTHTYAHTHAHTHTHTLTHTQTKPDYEFSEMILYEVQLMMEAGKGEDALKHISQFEPHICDFLTIWETKGMGLNCGLKVRRYTVLL